MKWLRPWLYGLALALGLAGAWRALADASAPASAPGPAPVLLLTVSGAIGPATALRFERALKQAGQERAAMLVLQLDTPGGLDKSMRDVIKRLLASPVPVAVFVAPQGARAASAGTYILYAAHVAAMAPATNLGAATPVAVGPGGAAPQAASAPQDAMAAKRVNDAVAYIRGLAQLRGRNADWAERAVRDAASLDARQALAQGVIDLVADDLPTLLRRLDGRTLAVGERRVTLATAHAPVKALQPGWRDELLESLSDPSVALALMTIGLYGLVFEFANPGFVLPGVVGGVSLLLGLFGLQMLPINHAGLALVLLGLALLAAEVFVPSFGVLGLGGLAAFGLGAALLTDGDVPGLAIPWPLIAVLMLTSAAFIGGVAMLALRTRRRPQVGGTAVLMGERGELLEVQGDAGWARVAGTPWRVRGVAGLLPGQALRVTGQDGLTLLVRPAQVPKDTPKDHDTRGQR
ncbi:NfeD family protein [Azohydromonas lata]|uniref:NfeD family protein n=1 Tax=Azohydromonas lata TaxID=45677 RepID=UPI000831B609|nr:nodulation protein NfeD [Azohydromonas lata]